MAFDTSRQGMAERIKHKDSKQGYTFSRLLDPLFWIAYMLSSFLLNAI